MTLDYLLHPRSIGLLCIGRPQFLEPEHPKSLELLDYWEAKMTPDRMVYRSAIQPREIVTLLPELFIAEPFGQDWRYRLLGTDLCARVGRELTWKTVKQIFDPPTADMICKLYDAAAISGEPRSMRGEWDEHGLGAGLSEGIHLPVRTDKGDTTMILGGLFAFRDSLEIAVPVRTSRKRPFHKRSLFTADSGPASRVWAGELGGEEKCGRPQRLHNEPIPAARHRTPRPSGRVYGCGLP